LTRTPLLVGVDNANAEQDPAGLNRILEVSGVPGNEPKTESMLDVRCAGVEASLQAAIDAFLEEYAVFPPRPAS
jgi:hypothetical protein